MASRGNEIWRGALGLGIVAVGLAIAELVSFGHHAVVCTGDLVADNTPLRGREVSLPTIALPKLISSKDESRGRPGEGEVAGVRAYDLGPFRLTAVHSGWWKAGYATYERVTLEDPTACTPREFLLYDGQSASGEGGVTASEAAVLRRDDADGAWVVTTTWGRERGELVLRRDVKRVPASPTGFVIGLLFFLCGVFALRRSAFYFGSRGVASWSEGTLLATGDIEPSGTNERVRAPFVGAPAGSIVLYSGVLGIHPTYRVAGGPVATMVVVGSREMWRSLSTSAARGASLFFAVASVVFAALAWR